MIERIEPVASNLRPPRCLPSVQDELDAAMRRRPLIVELPAPHDLWAWRDVRYLKARRLAARVGINEICVDDAYILARIQSEQIQVDTQGAFLWRNNFSVIIDVVDQEAPPFAAAYEAIQAEQAQDLFEAATMAIRGGASELRARAIVAEAARMMKPPPLPDMLSQALWAAVRAERRNRLWLNSQRSV